MKFHPNSTAGATTHPAVAHHEAIEVPVIPLGREQAWLGTVAEEWLLGLRQRRYSPRTISHYRMALRDLSVYLVAHDVDRVQDMDAACLEGWRANLTGRGLVAASVTGYLGIARNWCRWLTETGRMFINPAANLKLPIVPQSLGTTVSEADMVRLLDGVSGLDQLSRRDRAILELAYASAARLEEIARLNVESIDLSRGLVRLQGKGDAERIVPITRCATVALRDYIDQVRPGMAGSTKEHALFVSLRTGTRLRPDPISHIIRDRGAAIGLKVLPHMIRRSTATHMVLRGAPIAFVKALLGHRTYRHLARYVQIQGALAMNLAREGRKQP
jgi:site-specific recombinase XerC